MDDRGTATRITDKRSACSRLSYLRQLADPSESQIRQMVALAAMFKPPERCKRGHAYRPGGGKCLPCLRAAKRRWYHAKGKTWHRRWELSWKRRNGFWRTSRRKGLRS